MYRFAKREGFDYTRIDECTGQWKKSVLQPLSNAEPAKHFSLPVYRVVIKRCASGICPLQHVEVSTLRRSSARLLIPRCAVCARPLQHAEMATCGRQRARA